MRAFIALPLPDETLGALAEMQSRLGAPGRPVPEDNMHLTLAFLGDPGEAELSDLHEVLEATPLPAPELRFGPLGTFAEMERGLLFVSVEASPALVSLHGKVARAARMAGITLPRRRFRPHVTLFRSNRQPTGPARDRMAVALGQAVDLPPVQAGTMGLYRSTLGPGGARHEALALYPLSPLVV